MEKRRMRHGVFDCEIAVLTSDASIPILADEVSLYRYRQ